MKYYLALARNFILIILSAFAIAFTVGTLRQPPPNAPAIAEYQETKFARKLLSPSVFSFEIKLYITEKDKESQKDVTSVCVEGVGSAFTVNEKGYFATNNHVVDVAAKEKFCTDNLAKTRNVSVSSLFGLKFDVKNFIVDSQNRRWNVDVIKTFPESDVAVLKISNDQTKGTPPKKWKVAEFRTGSPHIVNGKVVSGTGPYVVPDEPIIMIGTPLELPFTITRGMLGNNTFRVGGKTPYLHFIAPINSGNSGGPVISLLDFKVIGMATMAKPDFGGMTQQSGAVPFWEIQKVLKQVDMK